ncbi:MAG: hypothetical protein K2X90_02310 [Candidatus Babeliaceae bacterium]|nr:hypothetical protein [Candidatus Babeliaceae bacterium]
MIIKKIIFYASLCATIHITHAADLTQQLEPIRQAAEEAAQRQIEALEAEMAGLSEQMNQEEQTTNELVSQYELTKTDYEKQIDLLRKKLSEKKEQFDQEMSRLLKELEVLQKNRKIKALQLEELKRRAASFIAGFEVVDSQEKITDSSRRRTSPNGLPERAHPEPVKPELMPGEVWRILPESLQRSLGSRSDR